MSGPILDLAFLAPDLSTSRFPPTSRYHGVAIATHVAPDGTQVPYFRRRLPPHPATLETIGAYVAHAPDRRDLAAATALGRAELWWRLADAAGAFDPDTVVDTPGESVRLTLDQEGGG